MIKIEGPFPGKINIESIEFTDLYKRSVMKNNDTSGKVNIPVDLVGQDVFILIPKKPIKSEKKKRGKIK